MKFFFHKIFVWSVYPVFFVFIAFLLSVEKVDFDENYISSSYYQNTLEYISKTNLSFDSSKINVSWGKESITPTQRVPLAGYGIRPKSTGLYDSIYVKSILFQLNNSSILLLNYDLLIIHPFLANKIKQAINKKYPDISEIIFTATHTHSSLGGWGSAHIGSRLIIGNDSEIYKMIENKTIKVIRKSLKKRELILSTQFNKINASELVKNRLTETDFKDDFIRNLTFSTNHNSHLALITFSAHPTSLSKKDLNISSDYVGISEKIIKNNNEFDFIMFTSGMVGSHSPIVSGSEYKDLIDYSNKISKKVRINSKELNIKKEVFHSILSKKIPIELPLPTLRITENYRIKNWLFEFIFGKSKPFLDILCIDNNLIITLPCELSGEFYKELDNYAKRYNLNLILMSFNGEYLGYVVPKAHFLNINHMETREMNWLGVNADKIFTDYLKLVIHKVGIQKSK